ncbi:MAG: hypothetical protein ACRDYZ_02525 [Acidimicrobiales bacterium]
MSTEAVSPTDLAVGEERAEGAALAEVVMPADRAGPDGTCQPDGTDVPDDLTLLADHERDSVGPVLVEALLELQSGDGPPHVAAAAARLLEQSAPWAVDFDAAASALLAVVGERDRRMYRAWSSWRSASSLGELGRPFGISATRVGQIVHRADAAVREALAGATGPLPWAVSSLHRRLGPAVTEDQVEATMGRLRIGATTAELVLWLAGPYRPVPGHAGWLSNDAGRIAARTAACLLADGGVRRLTDVEAELGFVPPEPWLNACTAIGLCDLTVSVRGPLRGALERILDAQGESLPVDDLVLRLRAAGRVVTEPAVDSLVRRPPFRRDAGGRVELVAWAEDAAAPKEAKGEKSPKRGKPAKLARSPKRAKPSTRAKRPTPPSSIGRSVTSVPPTRAGAETLDDRLWLWVRVDADVLAGAEGVVPSALAEKLGVVSPARHTFSSRYGPITLVHEGVQPVRGSLRAVAMAAGARVGDTLMLGFSGAADVTVDVRRAGGQGGASEPLATQLHFTDVPLEEARHDQ